MSDHSTRHDPQWFAVPPTFSEVVQPIGGRADHVGVGGFVCVDCKARNVMVSLRKDDVQIESAVTPEDARALAMQILAACDRIDAAERLGKH